MTESKKLTKRQVNFLKALRLNAGNITKACKAANLSRETIYRWKRENQMFVLGLETVEDELLDFAESQLQKQIEENNIVAVIFYLKTKGKNRGYVERSEVEHDRLSVTWNITKKYDPDEAPDNSV